MHGWTNGSLLRNIRQGFLNLQKQLKIELIGQKVDFPRTTILPSPHGLLESKKSMLDDQA